jgi:hypothetical protein
MDEIEHGESAVWSSNKAEKKSPARKATAAAAKSRRKPASR